MRLAPKKRASNVIGGGKKRPKKGSPNMVAEGKKAPDFKLPDSDDAEVKLSDLQGQNVVLYFYPKDDTPGCTTEARDFTALMPKLKKLNTVILGVSPDKTSKHRKFRDKHELAITLISDEEKTAAEAYGVWVEKSMYGKKYMGVERTTFLIGETGKILQIWRKVKVKGHADEVLEAVKSLS